jgi:hypothetical protein
LTPATPYSDLSGFGFRRTLWFDAYWALLALAMMVVAALFWVRGNVGAGASASAGGAGSFRRRCGWR